MYKNFTKVNNNNYKLFGGAKMNKNLIGIYFKIGNELYTTLINRSSVKKFKLLINNYSIDTEFIEPIEHKKYQFMSIKTILMDANNNLSSPLAKSILISLIAQNIENSAINNLSN